MLVLQHKAGHGYIAAGWMQHVQGCQLESCTCSCRHICSLHAYVRFLMWFHHTHACHNMAAWPYCFKTTDDSLAARNACFEWTNASRTSKMTQPWRSKKHFFLWPQLFTKNPKLCRSACIFYFHASQALSSECTSWPKHASRFLRGTL